MEPAKSEAGIFGKLMGYAMTGGVAAIVDLAGYVGLHSLGMAVTLAAALSFLLAALVNYLLSARFVFAAQTKASGFMLFLVFASLGFAINVGVTSYAQLHLALVPWLAKLLSLIHI